MEFCVLASGSDGNASFIRYDGFGVLIDLGINPRRLARTFQAFDLTWDDIQAVLFTHPHGDHWNDSTAFELHERGVPVYCHPRNVLALSKPDSAFLALEESGLIRRFELDQMLPFTDAFRCETFFVPHDAGVNCGFRFEALLPEGGGAIALGYLSDLGAWNEKLVRRLQDVDILALEFNHDETMQRESGRPASLINRVMGSRGHLSNRQAADFLKRLLARSQPGRLAHLIQLHLSRQCNTPDLAHAGARRALAEMRRDARIHTASASQPPVRIRMESPCVSVPAGFRQSFLPGWDGG